jgi:MerR family transcriptional regulator, heat shock protein HspR
MKAKASTGRRRISTLTRRVGSRVPTFLSRRALCRLADISEGQLRMWEAEDLIAPARIIELDGNREPLYTRKTLERIRLIRTLTEELEINLPGIEVILRLLDRLAE